MSMSCIKLSTSISKYVTYSVKKKKHITCLVITKQEPITALSTSVLALGGVGSDGNIYKNDAFEGRGAKIDFFIFHLIHTRLIYYY